MSRKIIAVGVDVGGAKKGFHAVALRDGAYISQTQACDPEDIAAWCREVKARWVAVDAPCHWRGDNGLRLAERQLKEAKISCFSTPFRQVAMTPHRTDYYGWMLNGAKL